MNALSKARVTVVGLGGVGSYAAEALARAPVGNLTLVDFDRYAPSNLNRQLHATVDTVGKPKADVVAERVKAINPEANVTPIVSRANDDTIDGLLTPAPDFLVDAIDETHAKTNLLAACVKRGIPVVSSMGAANKLDPARIRACDLSETTFCPLARRLRKLLRREGIETGITVVFSDEPPLPRHQYAANDTDTGPTERRPQGTISYLPAMFGLYCASVVIRGLLEHGATPPPGSTESRPPAS